jgi:hypothetical protein
VPLTGPIIRPVYGTEKPIRSTKFSKDVIPLADLKANPGRVVKHATEAHRPVLFTGAGDAAWPSCNQWPPARRLRRNERSCGPW